VHQLVSNCDQGIEALKWLRADIESGPALHLGKKQAFRVDAHSLEGCPRPLWQQPLGANVDVSFKRRGAQNVRLGEFAQDRPMRLDDAELRFSIWMASGSNSS
jgi:hypothetical protein